MIDPSEFRRRMERESVTLPVGAHVTVDRGRHGQMTGIVTEVHSDGGLAYTVQLDRPLGAVRRLWCWSKEIIAVDYMPPSGG